MKTKGYAILLVLPILPLAVCSPGGSTDAGVDTGTDADTGGDTDSGTDTETGSSGGD